MKYLLFALLVGLSWNAYADYGLHCDRGGKEYNDPYFGGKYLVRTTICTDGETYKIAVKNTPDSSYAKCDEFGWKDVGLFETDFFGNEKCDMTCKTLIFNMIEDKATEACLERGRK